MGPMSVEEFERQRTDESLRFYVDRQEEGAGGYVLMDRETGQWVGWDGGEPEDQVLVRDWAWVPVLLNELEAERRSLVTVLEKVRARLEEAVELGSITSAAEALALLERAAPETGGTDPSPTPDPREEEGKE